MNQQTRFCPRCKDYKDKRRIKNNGFKCTHCGYDFHKDLKPIPIK